MSDKNRFVLFAYISLFLLVSMFSAIPVSASTNELGIKAGNWVIFSQVTPVWISTWDSPANISFVEGEILNVTDGYVTIYGTYFYKNGTERTRIMSGNIATGEVPNDFGHSCIPPNLSAGDKIPANSTWIWGGIQVGKLTINGTITRSYAGANREVNYVNVTGFRTYGSLHYGNWNVSWYWDKETGIMLEHKIVSYANATFDSTHLYENMSTCLRIAATNMWPVVTSIDWHGSTYDVTMMSNSTISNFNFSQPNQQISFNVTGPQGKTGYCNVTIPKTLLGGNLIVLIDGSPVSPPPIVSQNSTHSFIYFTHSLSTHEVEITGTTVIPEFPTLLLTILLLTTLAATLLFARRKTINKNYVKSRIIYYFNNVND